MAITNAEESSTTVAPTTEAPETPYPYTDEDEALFHEALKASQTSPDRNKPDEEGKDEASDLSAHPPPHASPSHGRQPSLSVQSKIRSTSFRHSNGPLSPSVTGVLGSPGLDANGSTSPDGRYWKQASRIEELERENKRLGREVEIGEDRWRRLEDELEQMRERNAEEKNAIRKGSAPAREDQSEIEKLRGEISTLRAKQRDRTGSISKVSRSGSFLEGTGPSSSELDSMKKQVESKESTISDMSLEISKLRSQVSEKVAGCETHGSQIEALQTSLTGSEERFRKLEMELADSRKAVTRLSERSVKEGTENTSRETRMRGLERQTSAAKGERDDMEKLKLNLERKLDAMTKLVREAEERHMKKLKEVESEARRLREDKMRKVGKGGDEVEGDGDGVDDLEDEERTRLERRIRELEGEVYDLRRGAYRERRGLQDTGKDDDRPSFEVDGFDDVDLSANAGSSRRRSFGANAVLGSAANQQQQQHSSFAQVLNSGLAAFYGSSTPDQQPRPSSTGQRPRNDSLLQDFEDEDFDEAGFAQAQREEEARRMVEHVREVKKGLGEWKGWRLDLVEARRMMGTGDVAGDGGWLGEVFEI